jgi:acyl-CoA reductase-like NAD-dependent aldehyde dehydrogenase
MLKMEPVTPHLIIDGEWRQATDGRTIETRNPANPEEIVGYAPSANKEDTARAIATAQAAFPEWAALSFQERADYLLELTTGNLQDNVEQRAQVLTRENGKILKESMLEMTRLGARFEYTATLADRAAEEEHYEAPPFRTIITRQPRGVAALIIPWNWPLSILAAKLPQALLAGNTVVIKPDPTCSLATFLTVKLMADILPPGVINVVTGPTHEVGPELLENPAVRTVDFTGSVSSGRQIMAQAAKTLKSLTLELGGNDPGIVLEDANISEEAISKMTTAAFISGGQICMGLKRLYVHESLYEEVIEGLSAMLSDYVVGNGLDERATMGPVHNERQYHWIGELKSEARERGARVLEFGSKLDETEFERGYFHLPALVTDVDHSYKVVNEEQFGPVLPVMSFRTEEEALHLANDTSFGLCSSVWSSDPERAIALGRRIEAGYTYINNHGPLGQDNRGPFGGFKNSGVGRELGFEGVLSFLEPHSISAPG